MYMGNGVTIVPEKEREMAEMISIMLKRPFPHFQVIHFQFLERNASSSEVLVFTANNAAINSLVYSDVKKHTVWDTWH